MREQLGVRLITVFTFCYASEVRTSLLTAVLLDKLAAEKLNAILYRSSLCVWPRLYYLLREPYLFGNRT